MVKENNLSIAEMKTALRGKRYHFFSGWNGTERSIVIRTVRHSKERKGWFEIVGNNLKGNEQSELLPKETIQGLVRYGKFERRNEIDHCPYRDIYRIFAN